MRKRTRNSFSYGSMWMSLAPFWIADISIRFTRRMTGASPLCRSSEATSICSSSSSTSTSSSTARHPRAPWRPSRWSRRCEIRPARARRRLLLAAAVLRHGAVRVIALDGLEDGGFGGDDRFDVVARHELDVVHGEHVGRIRDRNRQRRAGAAERDDLVLLDRLGGNELDDGGVDLELRQVDRGHAVLLAEQIGDFLVLDEPEADQIQADLAAVRLLMVQRLLQLGRRDALFLEQQLADTNGHRVRPCEDRSTRAATPIVARGPRRQLREPACWGEDFDSTPVTLFVKQENAGRIRRHPRGDAPAAAAGLGPDRRLGVNPERESAAKLPPILKVGACPPGSLPSVLRRTRPARRHAASSAPRCPPRTPGSRRSARGRN